MAKHASLDALIAKHATEFAHQVRTVAEMADKEEEVRVAVVEQLARLRTLEPSLKVEAKHEFTLARGRADSVYAGVIVEYKNPSSAGARLGASADTPGVKKVVEQIKLRFQAMHTEHNFPIERLYGVGLDGLHMVFVRFRNGKWEVEAPCELTPHSAQRFLWVLFNLGSKGKPFSPEYLAGDFGSDSKPAKDGIETFYRAICKTDHPKAQTFFKQWKILFGEVCGYDVDNPSDKIKKLAETYDVPAQGLKAAELLFSVHSYYALFMKLLASGIMAYFHRVPAPLQGILQAPTTEAPKRQMEKLEAGSIFRELNITNFLEGDLFAWYLPVWDEKIDNVVREMVRHLDKYNPGSLSEDPAGSRDLLKKLYQQLFPRTVRHDLGEYYTPDWLAEHVLDELEYVGDPDKRILDPSCGSGTFLVMAINRIKKWYEDNREKVGYDEDELCRKVLANVIGFDLNPLAVMAARTNYLIAIRDLVSRVDRVEIPVYLCDSVLTPTTYGGVFEGTSDASKQLRTSAAVFRVPTEVALDRSGITRYAEELERCVKNGASAKEFIARCKQEGLPVSQDALHSRLYAELVRLDRENKNGVWARIIKNSFAPLFIGRVDYVAGNPPWVNWESLPETYRKESLSVWDRYGLKDASSGRASIGKAKHELAGLFVYVCVDAYLKDKGRLGFVITQSLFKNTGAAGFRRLQFDGIYLKPLALTDMVGCTVFEGAVNRTATFVVSREDRQFSYPVDYVAWRPKGNPELPEDATLPAVRRLVSQTRMRAFPSNTRDPGSPWLTCPIPVEKALKLVLGQAYYHAHEGVNSGGLVGAYWVRKLKELTKSSWLVENLGDAGKIKVPIRQARVESDLLFPLARGRDVLRWMVKSECYYLLTHDASTGAPYSVPRMRQDYPLALEYLLEHKAQLQKRKTAPVRQMMDAGYFHAVLGVGTYTTAKWKVFFKDLTELFQCCVVGPDSSPMKSKPIIADYTLRVIAFDSEDEAHYVAALLNSPPAMASLYYSSTGVQTQRYHAADSEKVAISPFTGKVAQQRLAAISKSCHAAAATGDRQKLQDLERELSEAAAEYWGVSTRDAQEIAECLELIQPAATLVSETEEE